MISSVTTGPIAAWPSVRPAEVSALGNAQLPVGNQRAIVPVDDREDRRVRDAHQESHDDQRNHRAGRGGRHQARRESGQERQHAPGDRDHRERAAVADATRRRSARNLEQRIAQVEAAEDPADLGVREAEFLADARHRDREVVAQQVVDEAQRRPARRGCGTAPARRADSSPRARCAASDRASGRRGSGAPH